MCKTALNQHALNYTRTQSHSHSHINEYINSHILSNNATGRIRNTMQQNFKRHRRHKRLAK